MAGELSPLPPNEPPARIIVPGAAAVPGGAERDQIREHVRHVAWLLDSAFEIPGTRIRVGLDPLIGLIPVLGDLIGMVVGGYIVLLAARLGAPRVVLMRMLLNVAIDSVLGSVPVAGDVLDAAWKANLMNARLLERTLADPKAAGRSSFWVVLGMLFAVLAVCVGGILLTIWLVHLLLRAME
jgi:hypothetical protein